jgi:very-short-patch-repair endonuclease
MNTQRIKLQKNAVNLRKNQTDAEQKLWQHLRKNQIHGIRFRRQYVVENYIVDFVALDLKLIIEVDGGQHQEQKVYDEKRTLLLESLGFKVLRFWNSEVFENLDGVLQAIYLVIGEMLV